MAVPTASRVTQVISTPASFISIISGAGDVAAQGAQPGLRLLGYCINESAGTPAAARVSILNGAAAGAPEVSDERLAASGQVFRWFGDSGIACPDGIFVDRTAGNTKLTIYYRVEE